MNSSKEREISASSRCSRGCVSRSRANRSVFLKSLTDARKIPRLLPLS
jgi:hypothetical protein